MDYIILVILWSIYCTLHSLLISAGATGFMKRKLGQLYRYYRLFYNTFAIVSLIPVVIYSYAVDGPVIIQWEGAFLVFRYIAFLSGILIFIAAAKNYDMLHLAGIRQIMSSDENCNEKCGGGITDTGVLGLVRHPFYSATFLLLWARDMSVVSIIINVILSLYLLAGSYLEERKLVTEFGDIYIRYRERVSGFFPYKWLKKNIARSFS